MAILRGQDLESEALVYGYIRDLSGSAFVARRQVNMQAISLLQNRASFRALNYEMFKVPRAANSDSYLIHFALAQAGIEYEWKEWMQQFEQLLGKMYWVSAIVHMETEYSGLHTFRWNADGGEHQPGENIHNSQLEWVRESCF